MRVILMLPHVSIHAPRLRFHSPGQLWFQSTPPARGATRLPRTQARTLPRFNPRPPRGGRRIHIGLEFPKLIVSIHAPRAGGDLAREAKLCNPGCFIDAPRAGGDQTGHPFCMLNTCFNPRPPRGGRQLQVAHPGERRGFNPRPPRGGATHVGGGSGNVASFVSIHAPRAGRQHCCKHLHALQIACHKCDPDAIR